LCDEYAAFARVIGVCSQLSHIIRVVARMF